MNNITIFDIKFTEELIQQIEKEIANKEERK